MQVPAAAIIGGKPGQGFKTAMKVLDRGRLHISAVAGGMPQRPEAIAPCGFPDGVIFIRQVVGGKAPCQGLLVQRIGLRQRMGLPTFMRHPRLRKPESIPNVQIEIQIVDTHESLETRVSIGFAVLLAHLNRTLLDPSQKSLQASPSPRSRPSTSC
ncbi:hypothetical protein B0E49_16450 [Polaromonas sp. C04]|nr:hypothetical protein B0E49_16450 [Polaromonas sp. C04]